MSTTLVAVALIADAAVTYAFTRSLFIGRIRIESDRADDAEDRAAAAELKIGTLRTQVSGHVSALTKVRGDLQSAQADLASAAHKRSEIVSKGNHTRALKRAAGVAAE